MHSYFFWDYNIGDFLIYGIKITTPNQMIGACFCVGFMAFFFEYLRYLQTIQKQKELKIRAKQIRMMCSTESSALLMETVTNPKNPLNITLVDRGLLYAAEVSFWIVLQILGYMLMMTVMLFDGWFLVAVVAGGGLGYFVFGQKFMKINLQNCRIIRESYCTQICGEADAMKRDGESTPAMDQPSTSQTSLSCHDNNTQMVAANVHAECHK